MNRCHFGAPAMNMISQNCRLETLNAAPKSSSAAPNSSSNLPNRSSARPNRSSARPKPSSRAQLEPYFKKPIFTTLSRQTPCDFSAEKSTSNLSATPLIALHDPRHAKVADHSLPLIRRSSSAQHERTPNPQTLPRLHLPSSIPKQSSKHERSCPVASAASGATAGLPSSAARLWQGLPNPPPHTYA